MLVGDLVPTRVPTISRFVTGHVSGGVLIYRDGATIGAHDPNHPLPTLLRPQFISLPLLLIQGANPIDIAPQRTNNSDIHGRASTALPVPVFIKIVSDAQTSSSTRMYRIRSKSESTAAPGAITYHFHSKTGATTASSREACGASATRIRRGFYSTVDEWEKEHEGDDEWDQDGEEPGDGQ